MTEKVFCKDCVFMKRQSKSIAHGVRAEAGVCVRIVEKNPMWFGNTHEYPINPTEQNRDNDCKYFQKRSWLRRLLFRLPPKLKVRF